MVDIAGLIEGAHPGKRTGKCFLSHIQCCDALFHLIRAFDDKDVPHVNCDVDPARDMRIISNELILKDLADLEKK